MPDFSLTLEARNAPVIAAFGLADNFSELYAEIRIVLSLTETI